MMLEKRHKIFIIIAIIALFLDIRFLLKTPYFAPLLIVIITIGWFQFWTDYFKKQKEERELEARFPDFVRNLVGAIKSGMPAPNAIVHVSNTDYGALSKHVKKLANQIEWSIPLHKALFMFANQTNNPVIKRAISTVIEAEMAGGNIEDVLESITESVVKIKVMKQKRKAGIHSQVIQSYVIFFVFLGIMIVIQNLLIPYMNEVSASNQESTGGLTGGADMAISAGFMSGTQNARIDFSSAGAFIISMKDWVVSMNGVFLMLAVIQGLFAGLVIGKLSEGDIGSGAKHSLILVTIAIFTMTLAHGLAA